MKIRSIFIVTFAALLLGGCGGPEESQTVAAPEPPADAQSAQAPETTEPAKPSATVTDAAKDALEAVEESAGDAVAEAAADDEKIVIAKAAETTLNPQQSPVFKEGQHYTKLTTAQGTSSPPDVIEVAEVFWYGCPHCFNFDPIVNNWAENLPDDVNFVRLPVMWNPTNAVHARLYYTADVLGKLENIHTPVFREMHVNNNMLATEATIRNFVSKHGISEKEFDSTFKSFAVETKLKRAKNLTQRYRIQSVPLLVVNGKYLTTGKGIKNFDDMLAVADELIARERSAR